MSVGGTVITQTTEPTPPTPTAGLPEAAAGGGGLKSLQLRGTYAAENRPLRTFYLPVLAVSCSYDRVAGYFSSSVLRAAAIGMRQFIDNAQAHGGKMRLVVGAQLSAQDVEAVRAGVKSREQAVTDAILAAPLPSPDEPGEPGDEYVRLLGWMVKTGLLTVKVGLPVDKQGMPLPPEKTDAYFHSKYGILTDPAGDKVAFIGSGNETAHGWIINHETFTTAKSWMPEVWAEQGEEIVARFEQHWKGGLNGHWLILDLPEVEDRLLKVVPHDYVLPDAGAFEALLPPDDGEDDADGQAAQEAALKAAREELDRLLALPSEVPFTAALTAPVLPLPHQSRLLDKSVTTFPRGYLFADPVGFGKTLELGFAIRELHLSGKAPKVLILAPASVLRQWQEELAEKLGLLVPRYENNGFLDVNNQPVVQPANSNPWSAFPIVLASSHLARRTARRAQILAAGPWDIVAVDEAHHARRRGSKPTDTPNSLLSLLQKMQEQKAWHALYLATATPMQMNPHETWDLLNLLGLPGRWGKSANDFVEYYRCLQLDPGMRDWKFLSAMLADYTADPDAEHDRALEKHIKGQLGLVKSKKIVALDQQGLPTETATKMPPIEVTFMDTWLRRHTPMRDRAFRNTRDTLRAYQAAGIIPEDVFIPTRHVTDEFIDLDPAWERHLYDRIEEYISRYYNAYMTGGQKALGFIMTVYRRRLTSSFFAIRMSLERRLNVLKSGQTLSALLTADDAPAVEDQLELNLDDLDTAIHLLNAEVDELEKFVHDLQSIGGEDTKATQLVNDLTQAFKTYETAVVFTQYADTMDYVRERLIATGYTRIGCYSGRGGEVWTADTHTWTPVSKSKLKTDFRAGRIQILIGTDSMSEGLNLQTASVLFNYDMPWNLMRVEQRIGRIDRIGSARPDVYVTNYFYNDTVEEAVYRGISEDLADFTNIIGSAQPVLSAVEDVIEHLSVVPADQRKAALAGSIDNLKKQAAQAANQPISPAALEADDAIAPAQLTPGITLPELEHALTTNALTAPMLTPGATPGTYQLTLGDTCHIVTFDRDIADTGVPLLSYGHPLFDQLVQQVTNTDKQ